jgi:hypothetical protein
MIKNILVLPVLPVFLAVLMILLTFALNCSETDSETIVVTTFKEYIPPIKPNEFRIEGLNKAQESLVKAGALEWCMASAGVYCPTIVDSGASIILGVARLSSGNGSGSGNWTDLGDGISRIELNYYQDDEHLYVGILHELAHHFGCTHFIEESTGLLPQWVRDVQNIGVTDAVVNCQRF